MSLHTSYHAESDADDEFERSVTSPPSDSEDFHSDSEVPSAEPTPTKFGHSSKDRRFPNTIITEWTAEECADFLVALGLRQYCETFLGMCFASCRRPGVSDWSQKTKSSAKRSSLSSMMS
jgi:hypothetical protein